MLVHISPARSLNFQPRDHAATHALSGSDHSPQCTAARQMRVHKRANVLDEFHSRAWRHQVAAKARMQNWLT